MSSTPQQRQASNFPVPPATERDGAPDVVDCDYLVIGAGASGMSFVDALLAETTQATFVIVDKHGQSGGHWVDAYSFVHLHGPAAYYGVPSTTLKGDTLSPTNLATGGEILAYYKKVEQDVFGPTGRVQFFFNSVYQDGCIHQLQQAHLVRVNKKIVDTTYANIQVPSITKPQYSIASGVTMVPPNALVNINMHDYQTYVVIGGGKTAMDTVKWILDNDVKAESVLWIRPRESWLSPRDLVNPEQYPAFIEGLLQAIVDSETVDSVFKSMEAHGFAYRLDPRVTPAMHKGATVSMEELLVLRRVENVIGGGGRVKHIAHDRIVLQHCEQLIDYETTLYIDCSSEAFGKTVSGLPVFNAGRITLQFLGGNTSTLSAAQIGLVESLDEMSDAEKNLLCRPLKQQTTPAEWILMQYGTLKMRQSWAEHPRLSQWLNACRLSTFSHVAESAKTLHSSSIQRLAEEVIQKVESGWEGLLSPSSDL